MVGKILFLAIALMMATVSVSFAQTECPVCSKAAASNTNWPERSLNQGLQGITNITLGWTEAFAQPLRENTDNPNHDTGYKLGNGVLKGWGQAIMMTGAGLLEAITFWTPVRIVPNTTCVGCRDVGKKIVNQVTVEPLVAAAEMLSGAGKTIVEDVGEIVPGAQQAASEVVPKD